MSHPASTELTPEQVQRIWRTQAQAKAAAAFDHTPILVYTAGKVGSTAVCDALEKTPLGPRTFHLHGLCAARLSRYREMLGVQNVPVKYHVHESEAILDQMRLHPQHPIKIITLVRDPIAQELSLFFENPALAKHVLDDEGRFIPDKMLDHLMTLFGRPNVCQHFLGWFERELNTNFGIDIFSKPFDPARPWQRYQRGRVEVLLMRLEDLSGIGPEVLADFLEQPEPIAIEKRYVRKDERYLQVRDRLSVPRPYCESIVSHPVIRHCYSDQEIDAMVAKWSPSNEPQRDGDDPLALAYPAVSRDLAALEEWTLREIGRPGLRRSVRRAALAQCQALRQEFDGLNPQESLANLQRRFTEFDDIVGTLATTRRTLSWRLREHLSQETVPRLHRQLTHLGATLSSPSRLVAAGRRRLAAVSHRGNI